MSELLTFLLKSDGFTDDLCYMTVLGRPNLIALYTLGFFGAFLIFVLVYIENSLTIQITTATCLIAFFLSLHQHIKRKNEINQLRKIGISASGVIIGLNRVYRYKSVYYQVVCQWQEPLSGSIHKAISDPIPTLDVVSCPHEVGDDIQIYYNPKNLLKYWVKTD